MPAPLDIDALYRTHGSAVLRRAREILGHEADAHEVLQDVFASLVSRPEQFAGRSTAMTFLYRVTTNLCLNRIRNARTRLRLLETKAAGGPEGPADDPEARSVVRDILAQLDDDTARAVVYYYVDEMSQAEAAELMGCSRRHVGNLLERFREAQRRPTPEATC